MTLWPLLALGAALWGALLLAVLAYGARWQTVKPDATHVPNSTPEEGTHA